MYFSSFPNPAEWIFHSAGFVCCKEIVDTADGSCYIKYGLQTIDEEGAITWKTYI